MGTKFWKLVTLGVVVVFMFVSTVGAETGLFTGVDHNLIPHKPFMFMPVARFMPSPSTGMNQVDSVIRFYFTNTTDMSRKFSAEAEYCDTIDKVYWKSFRFCFSDACHFGFGTTGEKIESRQSELVTFEFFPPSKAEDAKFGTFATARMTLYAEDDKSISDEMYFATVHIPFTKISIPLNEETITVEKCETWDPMNRDRAKRYPLVKTEKKLDQSAISVGGSMYIPLRVLAEEPYSVVGWDEETKTATFTIGDEEAYYMVELQIDNTIATLSLKTCEGKVLTKMVEMPASPIIRNGRTLVPFRSLGSHCIGGHVEWDKVSRTALLVLPPEQIDF